MSNGLMAPHPGAALQSRLAAADWTTLERDLDAQGCGLLEGLLTPAECAALAGLYGEVDAPLMPTFRSRVIMARHGYGRGEYKYFDYPLPPLIDALRAAFYPRLQPIANRWQLAMNLPVEFPDTLEAFLARCHDAGQRRPTPLLLKYGDGDYNCLHQDLYGEHVFPLQVVLLLSAPGQDFDGGEFVMTEQRPRMQSRAMVLPLKQGDAAVFAVNQRPAQGTRGTYRVQLRHGVSVVKRGQRFTAGVIFHDAT